MKRTPPPSLTKTTVCMGLSVLLLLLAEPGHGGISWLAFVALVPLLLGLSGHSPARAGWFAFLFGFFYHLLLLSWITIVLGHYGHLHPVVSWTALTLLAAYLGTFFACFGWFWARCGVSPHLFWLAPAAWVGLEYLRGWLFTGFPWMDLGYTQYKTTAIIQVAELFGHHGVSFLILLVNVLLARGKAVLSRPRLAAIILLCVASLPWFGMTRLQQITDLAARAGTIRVAVVQGNIEQDTKWLPAFQEQTVERYLALSRKAVESSHPHLVIWPETALPFYPLSHPLTARISDFAETGNVWLLTGAPHRESDPQSGAVSYFNSALLFAPSGGMPAVYNKRHLVPFGEYVPLRKILPFFAPVVETLGDFSPGHDPSPLTCGNVPIGVLICFEAVFPELARQNTRHGALLLANITNDAWFGRSGAPRQHFAMSVFRAVENRRPLARAANTGISGFIGPDGKISRTTGLFTQAVTVQDLPILRVKTLYQRGGHLFAPACLSVFLAAVAGFLARERAWIRERSQAKRMQGRKQPKPSTGEETI